jgi:alanine-glyoxylate transaminase/serine-glyoxylate transaminase/serine-pyruvate transaminase
MRIAYEELNTSFGSGLGPLNGKVFRIGHLGDLNEAMVLTALSVAELALVRAGADIRFGAGVGAAQACFAQQAGTAPRITIAAE